MARLGRSFPIKAHVTQISPIGRKYSASLAEAVTVTAIMGRSVIKTFSEAVAVAEATMQRAITKLFTIPITVTINMNRSITRLFSESVSVAEAFSTAVVIFLHLDETPIVVSDTMGRGVHKNFNIPVTVTATMQRSITRLYSEAISVTDSIVVGLARAFATAILVSDSLLRGIGKTFTNNILVTPLLAYIQSYSVHLMESISGSSLFNLGVGKGLTESIHIRERLRRYKNGIEILYDYYYRVKNTVYNAYKYLTQNTIWTDKY